MKLSEFSIKRANEIVTLGFRDMDALHMAMGEGGEIFILEMGTPVRIAEMARDLIRLSGKKPDEDIQIIFTGLREGEKLFEELITVGEDIVPTVHEKIKVIRAKKNCMEFRQQLEFKLE